MGRFGELIVAIRRDMGNRKTKISSDDVLRQLIIDYDQAKERGEFGRRCERFETTGAALDSPEGGKSEEHRPQAVSRAAGAHRDRGRCAPTR